MALLYKDEYTSEFHTLIEAKSPIPISKTISIVQHTEQNKSISLNLFMGDKKWGEANKIVAKITADRESVSINSFIKWDFTFEIDKNGILNVSAKDNRTDKIQSIKIQAFEGLSENDIKQLKKNANRSSI